jgi:hypothetical protein
VATERPAGDRIRDLIMLAVLAVWTIYAGAAVVQLFTTGAKVLESLPPFWFWGIPLGPYGAMYAPWRPGAPALTGVSPEPPAEPQAPGVPR